MSARLVLAALLLGASPLVAAQDPQRPIFRANATGVLVDVIVSDGRGSVANLTAADFELLDSGVAQTIADLDYGRLPMDVRMVFDMSGSVSDAQLERFTHAMTQVGASLKPGDRCEAWAFARRPVVLLPLTEPPIDPHITRVGADGTSFFDAVALAMITTPKPGRRQLTIVLSDGFDNTSFYDQPALIRAAQRSDAMVYTVAPGPEASSSASVPISTGIPGVTIRSSGSTTPGPSSASKILDALARTTGGRMLALDRYGDVAASFLKAIDEFRQGYVLRYVPEGVPSEGWHALTVRVRGNKKYTVQSRQGYEGGK